MWLNVFKVFKLYNHFFRISADQVSFGTLISCPEYICHYIFVQQDDQIFLVFSSNFGIGHWYAV